MLGSRQGTGRNARHRLPAPPVSVLTQFRANAAYPNWAISGAGRGCYPPAA